MVWLRSALAAGFWAVLCVGAHASPAGEALPGDPAVRRGLLPNGLRYALMPNATPKDGLSLRLVFDVGSLEEADEERGAAHFIEHMAFRDTRQFPEGELEAVFAPLGVGFGRDQNAYTSTDSTIYMLDLPSAGDRHREVAFKWLRDVADGVRFERGPVDRERGVVLAERAARQDPNAATQEAITLFQGPELRTVKRSPIGELAVLQNIRPEALRAFYQRWYRPEHAVLTVVGDLTPADLAQLEKEIARSFGDWRGVGPAPGRAELPGPDLKRGLDALGYSAPQVRPGILICRTKAAEPATNDMAGLRARTVRSVALRSLNLRLDRLSLAGGPVAAAEASIELEREAEKTCVVAGLAGEDWAPALAALQTELARFTDGGVSEDELEEAVAELRGEFLGLLARGATRDSPSLATEITFQELAGDAVMTPAQSMRAFNQAVEGLAAADLTAAWRGDWRGAGPFIAVVTPQAPPRRAILAAWNRGAGAAAPALAVKPAATPRWAYAAPGAPGKVVSRQVLNDPDFVRLRFANGVLLNFRQTSFDKGTAQVRVDFGQGREELGARSVAEGHLATGFFIRGGLGRHSYADLQRIEGSEAMSIGLSMDNHSFALEVDSFVERLEQQLRIMTAYLSDPGFRDDGDTQIPSIVANTYRQRAASPHALIVDGIEAAMIPAASRAPPPPAELSALRAADFAALLRPAVTSAPLEITLVGDLDEASAVEAVAATLGALPPRGPRVAGPGYQGYQRFPHPLPGPVRVLHRGPADKAAAAIVWPTFVASADRLREEYALELLTSIFDDALRHQVRERLGKAYSPSVEFIAADRADQGYLKAEVETSLADLPLVETEIKNLATRLAAGGVTAQMLEAARKPRLALAEADLNDNAWLAWSLHYASSAPARARELTQAPGILAALTLEEVQNAATTWLAGPPLIVTAMPEAGK